MRYVIFYFLVPKDNTDTDDFKLFVRRTQERLEAFVHQIVLVQVV